MSAAGGLSRRPGHRADGPFVIGLTGPIGCGKSTVARWLGRLGGTVIDADALSREVAGPGSEALGEVRARFGDAVLDASGALDRATLARIVFADAGALADLEAIVHPRVRRLVEAALERAASDGVPFVALEAIKLIEGGLALRCDEVWVISCSDETQRERLRKRGMAADDVERRLATQGRDLSERLSVSAHRVIVTDGDPGTTRERVEDALADALADVLVGLPIGDPRRPS